ncbi:MAG: hypothetical protein JWM98_164 [Thermoleophilia bacterium]|nr:hypothetical protein [Thermoleophilia bacterium]
MDANHGELLPGSHTCVGCNGLTFRQREDALCPRCAFEAETMMEGIEVEGLHRDLQLITEFEAYYQQREAHRTRFARLGGNVFEHRPATNLAERATPSFAVDVPWPELRSAS